MPKKLLRHPFKIGFVRFWSKNLMQNLFCCNSNGFLLKSLYVLFLFFRTHKSFEPAKKKKLKNG